MEHEHEEAARLLKAELRRLADAILDLEARGRLLDEAPQLLKLLGDARSRVFGWEVRLARRREEPSPTAAAPDDDSASVVEEAIQREQEAEREWFRTWGRQDDSEL